MPSPTYVALAKTVLTGTSSSVTFSSIVGTYTDLLLTASIRYDDGGTTRAGVVVLLNSQTTSSTDSSMTYMRGSGGTADTARQSATFFSNVYDANGSASTANSFSNVEIYIPNYAGSTNKVLSVTGASETNNATTPLVGIWAGLWSNTSAITTIKLQPVSGITNFASGSRFDLYGIKNS